MDLLTIEGVYENGHVELAEIPEGVERAKVTVTFLPETAERRQGRRKTARKTSDQTASPTEPRYPSELRHEYKALIQKKLQRTLTEAEAVRLASVRAEINRQDRLSASWAANEAQARAVEQELADLRQLLEAMPDA